MIGQAGDLTAAFTLRRGEKGLSLYRADLATARSVLQAIIAARTHPPTPGVTPEDLVAQGYRVVQMPMSVLEDNGFICGAPDSRGHFEVYAPDGYVEPAAAFEQFASTFARHAQTVLDNHATDR